MADNPYIPSMRKRYDTVVVPSMMEQFAYKNRFQVPAIRKVTLNMGVGEAVQDKKKIQSAVEEMALIAGQRPVITRARKSIAGFKLREGMPIGCKVTLRRARMYEFLDRLITVAMPRIRDFRGVSEKSFDGRGNYAMGLKEQLIFPEINYDSIDVVRGMDVVITTTAQSDEESRVMLSLFGFPFPQKVEKIEKEAA